MTFNYFTSMESQWDEGMRGCLFFTFFLCVCVLMSLFLFFALDAVIFSGNVYFLPSGPWTCQRLQSLQNGTTDQHSECKDVKAFWCKRVFEMRVFDLFAVRKGLRWDQADPLLVPRSWGCTATCWSVLSVTNTLHPVRLGEYCHLVALFLSSM